jgi:hypothetical protein
MMHTAACSSCSIAMIVGIVIQRGNGGICTDVLQVFKCRLLAREGHDTIAASIMPDFKEGIDDPGGTCANLAHSRIDPEVFVLKSKPQSHFQSIY